MTASRKSQAVIDTMLNPALLAAVIIAAAHEYEKESGRPMPWIFAFVIAPMVLHRATREALPTSTRTHLGTWLSRNAVVRAGLPQRAEQLVGYVRAGLRFGLGHRLLQVEGDRIVSVRRVQVGADMPADLREIVRRSRLVGRWLSKTDNPTTVLALLGMAP